MKAYEEIIEFIATGPTSKNIAAYKPSDVVKNRVSELVHKENNNSLSLEEESELDHYMQLEHLMRLVKARARQFADE